MQVRYFILPLLLIWNGLFAQSCDLITSMTFQKCADFVIDREHKIDPKKVHEGDIIYVDAGSLNNFFSSIHPVISCRYILITHDNDRAIPGKFAYALEDHKIIKWYAQNVENYSHPKLVPIPIGINYRKKIPENLSQAMALPQAAEKKYLLYMNFNIATYPRERRRVLFHFLPLPFCYSADFKAYSAFLGDVAASKFVLSPRGAGLDCFRTWEILYMGSIPVVRSSTIDSLFEGLPVLIVNSWEEVTEELLNRKYHELNCQNFKWEKLTEKYWQDLIKAQIE